MRIQHNIMAMNAYRNYTNNTSAVAKNLEKLSSGYRINRAGDDAAGLAISEKMRAQITGLSAAQKNVKDGISLVKTAEGATQEIHDMLNRMVYLAEQSANGTYQDEVDREAITNEFNQLKEEINRIADSSNFNGIKLLDGSLATKAVDSAADAGAAESANMQDIVVTVDAATGTATKSAAKGASWTTGDIADRKTTAGFEAIRFTYTNKAGESKTLLLGSKSVLTDNGTGDKGGEEVAAAVNGGTFAVSDLNGNTKDDLAEFQELFKVSGSGKNVIIEAKDPEGGAKITNVEYKAATTLAAAIDGLTATGKAEAAKGPEVTVDLVDTNPAVSTIKVGSDVFTSKEGANSAERAKDLVKQLKEAGYDASVKDDAPDNIVLKNLQQAQKDVQIENTTSDPWTVTGSVSTKGTAVFTMDKAANTNEHEFTVNYINQNGENATKKVTYKAGDTNAGDAGKALKAAIEGDAELSELFKVEEDSDKVTITSKGSGTASGYVTGVSSEGISVAKAEVTITKPQDTGKTLASVANSAGTAAKDIRNKDKVVIDGKTYQFMSDVGAEGDEGAIKVAIGETAKESWQNLQKALAKNGVEAEVFTDANMYGTGNAGVGLRFVDKAAAKIEEKAGGLTLQIGDTSDDFNQLTVSIKDMHTKALGIDELNLGNQAGAQAAVSKIKDAINYVSEVRGTLGATQNRLEHTQNNLSVMKENIQDAESSIRDTDIAEEMMAYTKNNILVQSAQAMLAQANQVPQGVLQLLG